MAILREDEPTKRVLRCTRFKNMILDMGGVFLQVNSKLDVGLSSIATVSPSKLKRVLRSNIWCTYQTGKISRDEALATLSVDMGCSAEELRQFLDKQRAALVPITEIVQLMETVELNLYCMTNCPDEDAVEIQKAFPDIFGRFRKIFTSSAAGMRKPNLNFFKLVLDEAGIEASETVFLDDDLTNIVAAESLGMTTVLVPSPATPTAMARTVKEIVSTLRTEEEQLSAAREYMLNHRGVHTSVGVFCKDLQVPLVFDQFIIADLMDDAQFLPMEAPPESGLFNHLPFSLLSVQNGLSSEQTVFMKAFDLPDDSDTTSIGLSVLHKFSKAHLPLINSVLDRVETELLSEDGLIQVYFDPRRPRVDPVAITNVLHLYHLAGRGGTVAKANEEFVLKVLRNRGYKIGSVYYPEPESFLVQLARVVCNFEAYFEKAGVVELLRKRVSERLGMEGHAMALAMRVLACVMCDLPDSCTADLERLKSLQNVDGSWDACPYYTSYNDREKWFANQALTTAFAIAAIEGKRKNTGTYGKCRQSISE